MTQLPADPLDPGSTGFATLLLKQVQTAGLSDSELRSLSPLALAYIGDAVYELFIRSRLLLPQKQVRAYHRQVVDHVRAEQQAYYLDCLRPHLTETETDILRRGRNAASSRRQRASIRDYQQATALEALIGYLYLTDPPRLMEVLNYLPLSDVIESQSVR